MTLQEYIAAHIAQCTNIIVVRNDGNASAEAILDITPDVLAILEEVWTKRYYDIQNERAWESKTKEVAQQKEIALKKKHIAKHPTFNSGYGTAQRVKAMRKAASGD